MRATKDPIGDIREQVLARLRELEAALLARGFSVVVETKFWLITATHRADTPAPARVQRVQLATDHAEDLHWYLLSPGHTLETVRCEPLCPAEAITEATERVARILTAAGR